MKTSKDSVETLADSITSGAKPNLNHNLPAYIPSGDDAVITWLQQFINALNSIYATVSYPPGNAISSTDMDKLTQDFIAFRNAVYSLTYVRGVAEALTLFKNCAGYDRNQLPVAAPKQEANMFPNANLANGGLLWRVVTMINTKILSNPAYTEDLRRQLGLIAPEPSAADLLALSARLYAPKFTGGEVILHGRLPKPAEYWRVYVRRGEHGKQEVVATVAHPKFTDHHELPAVPTAWTYTVELLDVNQQPVGKVDVVSVTVWRGAADQGPEAGR